MASNPPDTLIVLAGQARGVLHRFTRSVENRHAAVYVLSVVLQRASLFLILPILLRKLSTAEYGAFGLLQSLLTVLPPLLTANLPAAITRLYYDGSDVVSSRSIAARLTKATLAVGIASSVLLAFLVIRESGWAAQILGLSPASTRSALLLVIGGACGSAMLQTAYGIWRAERLPFRAATASIGNAGLFLGLAFTIVLVGRLDVVGLIGAYSCAALLSGGWAALIAPSWLAGRARRTPWSIAVPALQFSLPMLPYIIGLWVLGSGGRWLARAHLELDAVGYFTLASQLAVLIGLLGRAGFEAWAPSAYALFARSNLAEARAFLRRRTLLALTALGGVAIVIGTCLPWVLNRLAPQYAFTSVLFPIMALAPLFDIAHLRWHTELVGLKQTRLVAVYTVVAVLFFAIVGFAATWAWGLWGLAAAFSTAHAVQLMGAYAACLAARSRGTPRLKKDA